MEHESHHEHAHGQGHNADDRNDHTHHHSAAHEPTAETLAAYQQAYDDARPAPGGKVITVELEAREVDWEFVPGRRTRAWAYNGTIPGPTIEANVGDVLEIHLKNSLPAPTTIHWHGLRLAPPMDGTENVQRPVAPGGAFTYRFALVDEGTFWYHPHVDETVQLERGLTGTLIVRGPNEPVLDAERVLVIDDISLDRNAQIKPTGGWIEFHNGREGSTRLVNGRHEPELTIAAGQIERWRIANVSSARYVRLTIGGRPFRVLGTDGGRLEVPVTVNEVLLATADRVDLAVGPFAAGETLQIESLLHYRGTFGGKFIRPKSEHLATLRVGPAKPSRAMIPEKLRQIEPLVTAPVAPNREVRLGFKLSWKHGVDFVINKRSHLRDEPVKVGELQVWDIVNGTPVDHPYHLHGFFFQVLEVNGKPPAFLSWEDTVNIPAKGRVRIAWMPDDRPGEWMYHCHILEHHAMGMMAHFKVVR
jgi:FtsP/CotA-like multicopper oxidase with cupredoxin domain